MSALSGPDLDRPIPALAGLALAALLFASLPLALRVAPHAGSPLDLFAPWTHAERATAPPGAELESGDLPELMARGRLRALLLGGSAHDCAPGAAHGAEAALLEQFTAHAGLELSWVCVRRARDLESGLAAGHADVALGYPAPLPADGSLGETTAFGVTWPVLVTRAGDRDVASLEDLDAREIGVRQSSTALPHLRRVQDVSKRFDLRFLPDDTPAETLATAVATGALDMAVMDRRAAQALVPAHQGLRIALALAEPRPLAWRVRAASVQLRGALDVFLNATLLSHEPTQAYRADLDGIRERGVLRVLVREQEADFYLWRGELRGFEYELIRRFARDEGLRVEVIVPETDEDPADLLRAGLGDVVATPLSTHAPVARGLALTRPYRYVRESLLGAAGREPIDDITELAGHTVVLAEGSPHIAALERLQAEGIALKLLTLPASTRPADIIAGVAAGRFDLTMADAALARTLDRMDLGVRTVLTTEVETPRSWATRQDQPELGAALNGFIAGELRGEFYNVVFRKYFRNSRSVSRYLGAGADHDGDISPYDETVREFAARYGFDWRLIVAQMYQESRFDPDARSEMGARGLLQIMPRTAPEVGITEVATPSKGIHAGVRYLALLRDRFDEALPVLERTWFALAAYNAGYSRLSDARRHARELGLNPDRWFDNVEIAMQRLPRASGFGKRHRRCRCGEPVRYVRDIRTRYALYARLGAPLELSAVVGTSDATRG